MKHLIDRLQIAQGNNNVEELIPEAIEMLRQLQARNKLLTDVLIETNTFVRELRAENEALKAEIERRKEINIIRSLHE